MPAGTRNRPTGALERSLVNLTIGVAQSQIARKRALRDTETGEYEQQIQIPFSGNVDTGMYWVDKQVTWEMPFLYAPLQRRVPFQTPHFSKGFVLLSGGPGDFIQLDATVIGWTVTDAQWYVGATVRLSATSPTASAVLPFSSMAHLSFRGYATMAETDEFAK